MRHMSMSFPMGKKNNAITCPCCGNVFSAPSRTYPNFRYNYSILLNSTEEFFDLVNVCPKCGYAMLLEKAFDDGVSDSIEAILQSGVYRNILFNKEANPDIKRWILFAVLSELDENYSVAGIAYTKVYDFLELKNARLNPVYIIKAGSCFSCALKEYPSFGDALLVADSMRRNGQFSEAKEFCTLIRQKFRGAIVDQVLWKEEAWIDLKETKKRHLDIQDTFWH